jgi:membrane associated rhomboid family serine protease
MPKAASELAIEVLLACRAADKPLYAVDYAKEHGLDRAALDRVLDELRLKGLLRLTEWVQGLGQGYTLTEAGLALMKRPGSLRPGSSIPAAPAAYDAPDDDAAEPRRTPLIKPGRPVVAYALIGINAAVFAAGMFIAGRAGIKESDYLDRGLGPLADLGMVLRGRVLDHGEWWRIITYAFLHGGVIHLALNSYALFVLGPLLEALWGSARLLLLYFVAAVTGGCVVIWANRVGAGGVDVGSVGASGAISGLLTSLGVWVLLNRGHLPPNLASSLTRMVMINLAILVFISMQEGISWECHLGGAVGGALASFPLQLSRHGGSLRDVILGTLGTLLVPVVFLLLAYGRTWGLMPPL